MRNFEVTQKDNLFFWTVARLLILSIFIFSIIISSPADAFFGTKLVPKSGSNKDHFGWGAAIQGNTAVIAAPTDDQAGTNAGAFYVFTRDSYGNWTEEAKLFASDSKAGNIFGWPVAIDGDTIVVGNARNMSEPNLPHYAGAVYVFRHTENGWVQEAKLTASDGEGGDEFGRGVDISGDTIAVGALWEGHSGAVYVFTRIDGLWTEEAKLKASDSYRLGIVVAIDGNTIVADGAAAYIFTRTQEGWEQEAKLGIGSRLGGTVAIEAETVAIGLPYDDEAAVDAGAIYVFNRTAEGWEQEAKLMADDAEDGDQLGFDIAISGDSILTSTPYDDSVTGAAYLFTQGSGGWKQDAKIVAWDAVPGAAFGTAVALDSTTIIVGASSYAYNATPGYAYVFDWNLKENCSQKTDHCYQRFDNTMSWHMAKVHCKDEGGYLATITSKDEQDFVFDNVVSGSRNDCWIGATDKAKEGDWQWSNDEKWKYDNWETGQPDNCDGLEHYGSISKSDGTWQDKMTLNAGSGSCDYPVEFEPMSTICEWGDILGDLNGDNKINKEDYEEFRKAYGKCSGDSGYNSKADYDEDGCVSYRDYRIWYGYYLDYSE